MRPSWPLPLVALWALPAALGSRQPLCPAPCTSDPSKWSPYSSFERLQDCHHPVLLDFSSHASPNATEFAFKVLACTIEESPDPFENTESLFVNTSAEIGLEDNVLEFRTFSFLLEHAQAALVEESDRDTQSVLARLNTTTVGIYRGIAVENTLAASVIDSFRSSPEVRSGKSSAIQLCGQDRDTSLTFGIAVDTTGEPSTVQEALTSWSKAECMGADKTLVNSTNIAVSQIPTRRPSHDLNAVSAGSSRSLGCKRITVREGDTCAGLAERCGIRGADFMKYNPEEGLCSWLRPGEDVCCSKRVITKGKPTMNEDGSCASYITEYNNTCSSIARDHQLEESDILYYNDGRTWGWSGCDLIHAGVKICLSEGYPPLPAPKTGATCGPTVPGTEMPKDGLPLAALNPCPLNACCNTEGKCGASPEFCIYQEGPTGNPGTAPPGLRGCISNCGLSIIDNSEKPAEFMRIGYFEAFNLDRPCLNLLAAHIKVNDYTHINWGFATINDKYEISINDTFHQWQDFLALQGVKRIVSLGGWGYSVNAAAYDILREAMLPANVDTFIVNLMAFVEDNGLDGVDLDWEYPGVCCLRFSNTRSYF